MHALSVVRPEGGGACGARTSIAILFFVFLTACGGGGGGGTPDAAPPASGSLDLSFSADGIVTTSIPTSSSSSAATLALQSDGKIVVAGSATIGGVERFAVARYNADGTLDTSFGTGGIVTTAIPTSSSSSAATLALQSDGKIVVAGSATIGGVERFAVARYNADGTLDTSFGTGGIVTTTIGANSSNAFALALQSDGKIVVAGNATDDGVDYSFALARYNVNGALDTTFDADGIVTTTTIGASYNAYAVALQTDGKIVVAGKGLIGITEPIAVARYNSNGSLDPAFGGGIVTTAFALPSVARAVALQSDGKVVVAGNVGGEIVVARYTSTGALDTTFATVGFVTTMIGATSSNAYAVALQSDGKLVVAGQATNDGFNFFVALARYTSSGAPDTTFGTGGVVTTTIGAIAGASAVALQSGGKIVVAGSSDGSIALARYNP